MTYAGMQLCIETIDFITIWIRRLHHISDPLISIKVWIAHLLSERLQKLKPEITPTYALICTRRHIALSHHEE